MAAALFNNAKNNLASVYNISIEPNFLEEPLVRYQEAGSTTSMANTGFPPRFGRSRNITHLFLLNANSDNNNYYDDYVAATEARNDYIEGLMIAGAFVLAFFVCWSSVLVFVKLWSSCCDDSPPETTTSTMAHILAGRPFAFYDSGDNNNNNNSHEVPEQTPPPPVSAAAKEGYNKGPTTTTTTVSKWERRATRSRIVFLLSGLILVIFSTLLVKKGFQQVEETRTIADTSLGRVRLLLNEATNLTEDLRDVGTVAMELRDQLVKELDQDRLCPNDPNYLAQDEIGQTIKDNAGAAIDMLEMLGTFASKDIKQMENGLSRGNDIVNDIDSLVETAEDNHWVGMFFVVPLVVWTAILMVGAMTAQGHAMNGWGQFILSSVILPLFIMWVVASFVGCAVMAMSASANADLCVGSPDSTILTAAQNAGLKEDSIEYEIARYYLRQCTADAQVDPFLFLRTHDAEIVSIDSSNQHLALYRLAHSHFPFLCSQSLADQQEAAQAIVLDLAGSLEKIDVEGLSFTCGRDYAPLVESLDTMMSILKSLEKSATSGLSLLSCERIVPIYADLVYNGTCSYNISGCTWMFYSLLIISVMGMIMITLRSSYKNNLYLAGDENESTDEDSEFNSMAQLAIMNDIQKKRESARDPGDEDYDLQLQEYQYYRERAGIREDTSDSGSVYTDGQGDLVVTEIDPSEVPHNLYGDSPISFESYHGPPKKLSSLDSDDDSDGPKKPSTDKLDPSQFVQDFYADAPSYDTYGRPKPTAPLESDAYS